MLFDLQPTLQNDLVRIEPLQKSDFERLFAVAADPLIWAQHPNPNRWQRPDFSKYFEGAVASGGAFLVFDAATEELIGSSRFYDFDAEKSLVLIGYTFLKRSHWGGRHNPALKKLMLGHAFRFVERVHFHVGSENVRSQTAMARLGGQKIGELEVAYFGEPTKRNFIFEIVRANWP